MTHQGTLTGLPTARRRFAMWQPVIPGGALIQDVYWRRSAAVQAAWAAQEAIWWTEELEATTDDLDLSDYWRKAALLAASTVHSERVVDGLQRAFEA